MARPRTDSEIQTGEPELGEGERTLLIVGHIDTVHSVGSVPVRREGDVLYGPGVIDMKGGDIAVVWALKALKNQIGRAHV